MVKKVDIENVDPTSSILFLGSGFSVDATNIAGGNPPNGSGLRRHFIQKLGLPSDTTYDLQVLTEEFANDNPQTLRDELYRIFRIKKLSSSQSMILNEQWRRIYTTNYDDSVELHRLQKKQPPMTYDVSSDVPNKLPLGAVIHLHGSIRLVVPENICESLVLGEASYVNQYVVTSPWYDQFQRDIAHASTIYILGYSLADYHIAALLLQNPAVATRTIFIQGTTHDEIFLRRTANYGRTIFIGTDGFANTLAAATRPVGPSIDNLRSFKSLSPTRDRLTSSPPTLSEIYDLVVYGNFDSQRLARSQPGESYAITRADALLAAVEAVEKKAALVVDGRLGNGKTVFLHLLALELSARGWRCLLLKPGHPAIFKEMTVLQGADRVVVFIEQYSAAQDTLKGLREALPNAKLVIEVRTGTYEVRFHELTELLPKPFDRVSLNTLSRVEARSFSRLCQSAGLKGLPNGQTGELRDILLGLYNNQSIRDRVRNTLAPLFMSRSARRVLTMAMLIATHQSAVGAGFIRSITGEDPFIILKPLEDLSIEILELSADVFRARSAIFSEFVIRNFVGAD